MIEKLLEKQSGFEKVLAAQEERFLALENLTTVSLLFFDANYFCLTCVLSMLWSSGIFVLKNCSNCH